MKRKDIITKLIKEGFSGKTLAGLNDKQLNMLSSRILGEQYNTDDANPIQIPKTDQTAIQRAKQDKKQFVAYEGEMKEDEEKDKGKDESIIIKRIKHKIARSKDEKKIKSYKNLLKRIEDGKVKASGVEIDENEKPKFKSKTEWLKSKGIIKDDDKKEEPKESIAPANQPVGLSEWVDKVVQGNVYPFTSKNEIMNLINKNLSEQEVMDAPVKQVDPNRSKPTPELPSFLSYDEINNAGETAPAEPKTRPKTRPGKPEIRPKKDNPYQPGPGINPAPKAEKTQ